MDVHSRQFILAKKAYTPNHHWRVMQLSFDYYLSYECTLSVSAVNLYDRRAWCLGEAISVASQPQTFFATPAEYVSTHVGRFVLIDWPFVYQDPCGLLGLYCFDETDGTFCTSSPSLAAQFGGLPLRGRQLKWNGHESFFRAPGSRVANLRKLLPDQILEIATGRTSSDQPEFFRTGARDPVATLAEVFGIMFDRIADRYDRLFLALTAGLDSRTLLAGLLVAGVEFEAVTHTYPGVSKQDVTIARRLCRRLGVSHHIVEPLPHRQKLLEAWHEHTVASYTGVADNHTFPGNQYRFLSRDDAIFRGSCFELGRRFYERGGLGEFGFDDANNDAFYEAIRLDRDDAYEVAAVHEWLSWRRETPIGADVCDAYYYDQRLGSWVAAIEQGLDSQPGHSLNPGNCSPILAALMTPDCDGRRKGDVQRGFVQEVDRVLGEVPINPKRRFRIARKAIRKFKSKRPRSQ